VTTVVAAFVIVAAVAIVIQMGIMLALYLGMKQTATRMEGVATRLEQQAAPLLATATDILDDARPKIAEITSNLAESSATVRAHVSQMAETSAEIMERARLNAERVDEFVGSTMNKIEMASGLLESRVLTPVRRVQAIIQAIGTGLSFLRSNRSRSAGPRQPRSREDEEMFI
jgi:methyl-accepting chemotaxis protein